MNPYNVTGPSNSQVAQVESIVSQRLKGSFLWMVVGLLTTIGVGFAALANPNWLRFAYQNFYIILLVEIGVIVLFSARAYTANVMTLRGMFFLYSALNGLTLTLISLRYNVFDVVIPALVGTLAFFIGFAIVGATTKRNLSSLTPYVMAALIGMIIVSFVMIGARYFNVAVLSAFSDTVSLVLGYVGVVVFSIFTAIDVNRIKNNVTEVALMEDESILDRIEITGALNLYLDFINLFLSLLRIFGNKRHMEKALGHSLLLRTAEGIALTAQGEIFYDYCKRMMQDQEALENAMNSASGKIQGTLKIASSINFADYELPALLKAFREQYPDVHIQVKTAFSHQVVKMFNTGDCMVAFARGGYDVSGKSELLLAEPYCLVYKELVPPESLEKVPFIKYQTDVSVANIIETWCAEHFEEPPSVAMDVNSMSTCRHFVRAGLGWSILTYMGLGSCKDKDIYVSPLRNKDGECITRDTNMVYTKDAENLVVVKTFIEYVRNYYKEHTVVDNSIFREYKA